MKYTQPPFYSKNTSAIYYLTPESYSRTCLCNWYTTLTTKLAPISLHIAPKHSLATSTAPFTAPSRCHYRKTAISPLTLDSLGALPTFVVSTFVNTRLLLRYVDITPHYTRTTVTTFVFSTYVHINCVNAKHTVSLVCYHVSLATFTQLLHKYEMLFFFV